MQSKTLLCLNLFFVLFDNGATQDVCNLPAVTGPCKADMPRYFYNAHTCHCDKFTYGGCDGNGNRYEKLEDCNAACGEVNCPICNLPPSRGPCKAKQERWYFDATSCTCKTFTYGGCKGNLNRFMTKQDCEGSCGSYQCPVCALEMKVGPCKGAINRWYYDTKENKCKQFSWGGCEPNGNNFQNEEDCKKICKGFKQKY
ncbi:carboxypeptidase inhibitor SmCI-like [Dreissena polymorpha]|uniref:BPTI/Kunitz inhibitor domain-containing protein n=1 Tax=Dreissena polymorpha TaxID=45954 RepID=A0A9D4R8Q5_DREPO|nr:carboxypeptidase inhibitor SmCI-like [Dreissena polymorpha]KAH3859201.1 hypothetical protein DPMN_101917 [Dreissena polymorpha]